MGNEIINNLKKNRNIFKYYNSKMLKKNIKFGALKIIDGLKTIPKYKIIKGKQEISSIFLFNIFIILILLFIINSNSKKIEKYKKIKLYSNNEIKIKILGGGEQNILYDYFNNVPDQLIVNGKNSSIEEGNKIGNLKEGENIIIMKWNNKITSCNEMFSDLTNLIEVDFSNLDASELVSMVSIFYQCTNLTSVNLTNFYAPTLDNLLMTFNQCESLLSLDFSTSYFPLVSNMGSTFYKCKSLKSINFGNFQASNVKCFEYLFYSCTSLQSIDLSNFNTSSLE